jgi:hypothetical protein
MPKPFQLLLLKKADAQQLHGTPLETDNSTATGILPTQVRMKRSKAFTCAITKDQIARKQFNLYWALAKPIVPIFLQTPPALSS